MIRVTSLFGIAMLMAGCATSGIADLPGGFYRVQPPDSAIPMESWDEVVVQREDKSHRYLSHVLNTTSKTTLTIIDPATMATLISCTQEGDRFSRTGIIRSNSMPPELPLALLQLIAWPETAARNGLSPSLRLTASTGVRTIKNEGEVVLVAEDLTDRGRLITLPGYATKIVIRPIPSP